MDPDPDPLLFQGGNVPKMVLFVHLNLFSLSGQPGVKKQSHIVKFSLSVTFCCAHLSRIRTQIHLGTDPDPGK
jgi:hypothetical protein